MNYENVIWIRTGKTAGTSIDEALKRTGLRVKKPEPEKIVEIQADKVGPWYSINQFKYLYPEIWQNAFKFMVCRNPYDRAVSAWKYLPKTRDTRLSKAIRGGFSVAVDYHFLPQTYGIDKIDFVVRFEFLQFDFNRLCKQLGINTIMLKHMRKSEHLPYQKYYDEMLAGMVYKKYKADFDFFNYNKDSWYQ